MKLRKSVHTSRPWRIHELVQDFRLEDVWALPTPGGPDDFPRLVTQLSARWPREESSGAVSTLWTIRKKVGASLGWDDDDAGATSLRDRLPEDLRDAPTGPTSKSLPFTPVYLLDR